MEQKENRELEIEEIKYLDTGIYIEMNLSQAFTTYKIILANKPNKERVHVPNDYGYFYEHIRGKEWYEKISRIPVYMSFSSSEYDKWAKVSGLSLLGVAIEHSENRIKKIRNSNPTNENFRYVETVKKLKKMYNVLKHNGYKIPTKLDDKDYSAIALVKNFSFNLGDELLEKFDMEESTAQIYVYFMDFISHLFDQKSPPSVNFDRIFRVLNLFHQK